MSAAAYGRMKVNMRPIVTRIDSSDTKDFPAPLEHNKMRNRGYHRLFWSRYHSSVHQGAQENERAGLDIFVVNELAK